MNRSTDMDNRPTPDDFDAYVPWACKQLMIPGPVIIARIVQLEYGTERKSKPKAKQKQSRVELSSDLAKEDKSVYALQAFEDHLPYGKVILIKTIYDHNDNLVQIKFDKCKNIPRGIFKLLTLIMQFHTYCTNMTINRGIENNTLIDIVKVISVSNVTDLCLDDTAITNAYYHILLKQSKSLRYLSLCRCGITDEQVEKIAEAITYPEPSSTSLTILNLGSNRITDVGAKYIAVALRTNRQLSYLNISDNVITDEGVIPILTCLSEFLLTTDELRASRTRLTNYLRNKQKLVSQFMMEMKSGDLVTLKSKNRERKNKFLPSTKIKKGDKEPMSKTNLAGENHSNSYEAILYEKSTARADAIVGEFYDPFSQKETFLRNYQLYSTGNNKLCYLNLAYNNITVISLRKLLKVLVYQRTDDRKGKGLINVNLDGNYLPKTCIEMVKINDILQSGMVLSTMQSAAAKKKHQYFQKNN